jgi:hypothetical protein
LLPLRESYAFQRRLYPSLQIFGGGALLTSFFNVLGADSSTASLWVTGALAAVGVGGVLLALQCLDRRERAARWCFAFWALQILTFSFPVASYTFSCGAALPVLFQLEPLSVSVNGPHLGAEFLARVEREGPLSYVGINLIALAASRFYFLEWLKPTRSKTSPSVEAKP